ncbi:hypothetical protein [Sphingobium fluviale]|uniref:Uncharacterized protein n=1 Tax=Sphingobium fluviale TaxID=2506423 RepID=A0A4Q1KEX7_9SPHN|nr:hypothetical protein [Sphingobium fluviale]RXR26489.1 hypothetical protein EQG66_13020 [Sphingobium fluviale]
MPNSSLHDAIDRLDRAVASAETALAGRDAQTLALAARKDAAVREALEELDGLIAALNGGRNG